MTQAPTLSPMRVWKEWPQFFRGAGGLVQRLRLSRSQYDVRARLIWQALLVESVPLNCERGRDLRSGFIGDVGPGCTRRIDLLSFKQFGDGNQL